MCSRVRWSCIRHRSSRCCRPTWTTTIRVPFTSFPTSNPLVRHSAHSYSLATFTHSKPCLFLCPRHVTAPQWIPGAPYEPSSPTAMVRVSSYCHRNRACADSLAVRRCTNRQHARRMANSNSSHRTHSIPRQRPCRSRHAPARRASIRRTTRTRRQHIRLAPRSTTWCRAHRASIRRSRSHFRNSPITICNNTTAPSRRHPSETRLLACGVEWSATTHRHRVCVCVAGRLSTNERANHIMLHMIGIQLIPHHTLFRWHLHLSSCIDRPTDR